MATTNILILCGSIGGNAQQLAMILQQHLEEENYSCQLAMDISAASYNAQNWDALLLVSSTTGVGDMPPTMLDFDQLCQGGEIVCYQQNYAIIGLGDSSYDDFCQAAVSLQLLMQDLAAKQLCASLKIDALEYTDPSFALPVWLEEELLPALAEINHPAPS